MWLELDAGNTRLKWRISKRIALGTFDTVRAGALLIDAGERQCFDLLAKQVILESNESITRVLVANVRGEDFGRQLQGWSRRALDVEPVFAEASSSCRGVTNGYTMPSRLGIDRWLAVIAAFHAVEGPCCVVDCGTAITVDLVDAGGMHKGGFILPGIQMQCAALEQKSALLIGDGFSNPSRALGQNTGAAISNGILAAICGMLESMGVTENSDCEPMDVVLTGGDASLILPLLVLKAQIKTHLVLDGLRIMFDQQ